MPIPRRLLPALLLPAAATAQERPRPVLAEAPEGQALVARLRQGGLVLFFRHADTRGEPCDRSYRIGDRAGQRNLAPEGRAQAVRLGAGLAELASPSPSRSSPARSSAPGIPRSSPSAPHAWR